MKYQTVQEIADIWDIYVPKDVAKIISKMASDLERKERHENNRFAEVHWRNINELKWLLHGYYDWVSIFGNHISLKQYQKEYFDPCRGSIVRVWTLYLRDRWPPDNRQSFPFDLL